VGPTATRYFVGDKSPSPLILHVKTSDGQPYDLSNYDTITVTGDDDLPPGDTSVLDAENGIVQRTFDTGFEAAGLLLLRVKMETTLTEDWATDIQLPVYDPTVPPTTTLLLDTGEVEGITGVIVSENDISRAQSVLTLVTGRNLGDAEWISDCVSTGDQFWLKTAVAWQSAETTGTAASAPVIVRVPGATSIANGDVSISFSSSGNTTNDTLASLLTPSASIAIRRVSWMGAGRTVHATGFLQRHSYGDPWSVVANGVGFGAR
jgi:hypothetical protein